MARVLIIDDEIIVCQVMMELVKTVHHESRYAQSLKEGIKMAEEEEYDVVFLDVAMPDGNGLDALHQIRALPNAPEVVIITGAGGPDAAETAIRNGAWDFIQKPVDVQKVILPLQRVLQYRENLRKARKAPKMLHRERIIGNCKALAKCLEVLAQAASTDANVLITGETGTGKEIFARTLHENSSRSEKNFVVVDCAALPETLVENAIFGHVKGAFTGADQPREGLVQLADGGTLFLDEVGELSLPMQKAFLRVLQEKKYRPVGGSSEIKSDFRLIAATNREPEKMVEKGSLRKDLLYRLRSISMHLPPLRERKNDIRELVLHYTEQICAKSGIAPKGFSPEFFGLLSEYDWPGNIRELIHALESAVSSAADEPILFPVHLPDSIRVQAIRSIVDDPKLRKEEKAVTRNTSEIIGSFREPLPTYKAFRESILSQAETAYLEALIKHTRGNVNKACEIAGIGRSRLYTLFKKHGIRPGH